MIKNLTLMILPLFATIHLHTQCDLQVKRVTIYKDGTAFIEKEGRCQVENGRIKLNQIKAPITSGNNYNSRNQTVANNIHWLIKDSVTKLQSLNARNLVCWELEVSANGKATISYSYEIIVD